MASAAWLRRSRRSLKRKKPLRAKVPDEQIIELKRLWRAIVMVEGRHRCSRCKAGEGRAVLQGHHVMPKGKYPSLKYDPDNGIILCLRCHTWWHHNPESAHDWFRETFGEKRWDALRWRARTSRVKRDDLAAHLLYLRQRLGGRALDSGDSAGTD